MEIGRATFTSIKDAALIAWDDIAGRGGAVFKGLAEAVHGNFAQAWETIKAGWKNVSDEEKKYGDEAANAWVAAYARMAEADKNLWDLATLAANQKARLAKLQANPSGDDANKPIAPQDNKTAKARLDLLRAQAQNELTLWKALREAQDAADKDSYDRGIISVTEYFNRRRATISDSIGKEILVLQAEYVALAKTPTQNEAQRLQKQKELEAIQTKIAGLEVANSTQQINLDRQEYDQKIALAKQLLGYQEQILSAQGNTFAAAIVKIGEEADEIQRALAKAGLTPSQVADIVAQLQQAKTLAASFEDKRKSASLVTGGMGLMTGQLDNDVAAGKVLQINQERELAAIYAEELPKLQQIAQALRAIAEASGDPQKVLEAEQFAQQVDQIAIKADYAAQQMVKYKNEAVNAFQSDLSTFLQNIQQGGQALQNFALSLGKSIQKIFADAISEGVTRKLTGLLGLDKTNGGAKSATAMSAAAVQLGAAGATVGTASAALAAAAAQLLAAANALAAAGGGAGGIGGFPSFGGMVGGSGADVTGGGLGVGEFGGVTGTEWAGGGHVRGPGSSTSDSIPAYLSDGEYVVKASTVNRVGVPFLHALNTQRFSAGGFVGDIGPALRFAEGGFAAPIISPVQPSRIQLASPASTVPQIHQHYHRVDPATLNMSLRDWFHNYIATERSRS